ncbi:hypothetical protein [Parasphingorhabdus sp.]|jgi:hypothetical protein|uniref:hypothetical protein n=1 Tax=Parasphingorhabdus sp. TaxID=2709688 RepID=UPI003D2C9420
MIAQYLQLAPLRANADVAMPVYPSHRDELCYHLHALEPYIENGGWLVEEYWLADICYAPLVLARERMDLESEVASLPRVEKCVAQLKNRTEVQEVMVFLRPLSDKAAVRNRVFLRQLSTHLRSFGWISFNGSIKRSAIVVSNKASKLR